MRPARNRVLSHNQTALPVSAKAMAKAKIVSHTTLRRREEEKKEEVETEYRPILHGLYLAHRDEDILGHLSFLLGQVKARRGFPYKKGSLREVQIQEMVGPWRRAVREGTPLSNIEWQQAIEACIDLRSRVVPFFWFRPKRYSGPTEGVIELNQKHLAKQSSWAIIQSLTSLVGSCTFETYELKFIADHWKIAWEDGSEKFAFKTEAERSASERLLVEVLFRERVLRLDQIDSFKSMVGWKMGVPVWQTKPVQLDLFKSNSPRSVQGQQLDLFV